LREWLEERKLFSSVNRSTAALLSFHGRLGTTLRYG